MKSVFYFVLILLVGALIGTFLGKLIVLWFPAGPVQSLFATHQGAGLNPATLDLGILTITFGAMFNINITGLIGIAIAAILSRSLFK